MKKNKAGVPGPETVCAICGARPKKGSKIRFCGHHASYSPEVIVTLCYPCHAWLHGNGKIYRHPIKEAWGKDLAPYEFCRRVAMMYEKALGKTGKD